MSGREHIVWFPNRGEHIHSSDHLNTYSQISYLLLENPERKRDQFFSIPYRIKE